MRKVDLQSFFTSEIISRLNHQVKNTQYGIKIFYTNVEENTRVFLALYRKNNYTHLSFALDIHIIYIMHGTLRKKKHRFRILFQSDKIPHCYILTHGYVCRATSCFLRVKVF